MLEKPNIQDELIISHLQSNYDVNVTKLIFLPIGADMSTAVYRVVATNGAAYFLKIRKGFEEISVTVPLFLKTLGVDEVIAPIKTKLQNHWADFGDHKLILYPFIEGKDGFESELSDQHKKNLGAAFSRVHTTQLPSALKQLIPKETFSSQWRNRVRSFQAQVDSSFFEDSAATKLTEFMKSKRNEITHIINHTEQLASELQSKSLELVLCHTDIHGGNILISDKGNLYIVDWDNPILAPKERDLMFIGGGIDEIWKSKRDESMFYEGYGKEQVNLTALAYFRYERIIQDFAAYCEQLLLTSEGGADREQGYEYFISNFKPGNTIEIADKTENLLS